MIAAVYARKSTEQNGAADELKSVTRQVAAVQSQCTQRLMSEKDGSRHHDLVVLPLDRSECSVLLLLVDQRHHERPLRGVRGILIFSSSASNGASNCSTVGRGVSGTRRAGR